MLTIFFAICMAGIAEREKRRGWLWGLLTALLSAGLQVTFIPGYWGAVLGLLAAFALMTYANIKYPVNKGPILPP